MVEFGASRMNRSPSTRRILRFILPTYLALALVIALLLFLGIIHDYRGALTTARKDMIGMVRSTGEAMNREIAVFKHEAKLLVDEKQALMDAILASPDPNDHLFELAEITTTWFPNSLAFTIGNAQGRPLLTDFKGNLGPACIRDMRRAIDQATPLAPLHGQDTLPHFDITIPLNTQDSRQGVFLVTFSTEQLVSLLNRHADSRFELSYTDQAHAMGAIQRAPDKANATMHAVEGSDIYILGQIRPEYQAGELGQLRLRLAVFLGGFLAFAAWGAWLLRQGQARLVRETLTIESLNQELRNLSLRDPLTGLLNRRAVEEHCGTALDQARREGHPVTMALLDIDHFKRINDQQGHDAGDECLRLVAGILNEAARRPLDLAVRYGGEEFLMCWYDAGSEAAVAAARAIQERVRQMPFRHADGSPITLSVGVVSAPPDGDSAGTELISRADAALYRAKNSGRDRIEVA